MPTPNVSTQRLTAPYPGRRVLAGGLLEAVCDAHAKTVGAAPAMCQPARAVIYAHRLMAIRTAPEGGMP